MSRIAGFWRRPDLIGIACSTAAVALGLAYLTAAGAPVRMPALNLAAWLVGLAAFATLRLPNWRLGDAEALILPGLGALLLATAMFGASAEGAARWVQIGPLNLQVSLILLPIMLIGFARSPRLSGAIGMGIAALALALQPDRAVAAALAAGLGALACVRRDRIVLIPLSAACAGLIVTLLCPDTLPALPYVDQIFYTSFGVHPLAGLAVTGGACLLLVPAFASWSGGAEQRRSALVFGACWLIIMLAAAAGNYPTPLVGYGGSAIVGYLLSLGLLRPSAAAEGERAGVARKGASDGNEPLRAAILG